MTAERDIAGFALPFAIGIMAATSAGAQFSPAFHLVTSLALLTTAAALFCLMHPMHRNMSRLSLVMLMTAAALGCGCVVGLTDKISSIGTLHPGIPIPGWAEALGLKMQALIDGIPFESRDTNHLIKALVTGERHDMPAEMTEIFRSSGASHILALSGLHLGIIYGILKFIAQVFGNSPRTNAVKGIVIVIICGIYTAATGAGASITRAFLFILLAETARLTGRYGSTSGILMTALVIQLLMSPQSVRNVGFQLSYAAMAGIAFILPWLKRLWPEGRGGLMKWIWNSAAVSLSCQITTGPLAYLYFGTFPEYFLLTNLTALPLVGIVIPLSLLTTLMNALGICPSQLIWLTESLISGMTSILSTIASL